MNAFLKKAGLGIALAATALTASAPADAQRWGGYRGYHGGYGRGGDVAGAAVLGGILGLGVGAAIASNHNRGYYNGGYYREGYYDGPPPPPRAYYNGYGYDGYYAPHCWRQWRWDPYYGRNVPVRVCN